MRVALFALLSLLATAALAQPVLEERLILTGRTPLDYSDAERVDFSSVGARPLFQNRIARPSFRDALKDYQVRVRNDGVAVQKRIVIGK